MSGEELLRDYTRVREVEGTFILEILVIHADRSSTPSGDWRPYRSWKKRPSPERVQSAQRTAVEASRFFGRCSRCGELNLAGRMHDARVCRRCAERFLGIVP